MLQMKKWMSVFLASGLLFAACSNGEEEEPSAPPETEEPDEPVDEPETDPETEDNEEDTEDPNEQEGEGSNEEDPTNEEGSGEGETSGVSQNLADWLPMQENTRYVYETETTEGETYEVIRYPHYVTDQTVQFTQDGYENTELFVDEYREDAIVRIFQESQAFQLENVMETGYIERSEEEEIVLQLPIEEGTTWEGRNNGTYEILSVNAEVETPYGTFEAVEVYHSTETSTTVYHYAEGIGLIQTSYLYPDADNSTVMQLAEIQEDSSYTREVLFYRLTDQADGLEQVSQEVERRTNDSFRQHMESFYKGQEGPFSDSPLIGDNGSLQALYKGTDERVYADFNQAWIDEMNAGSGTETLILQSFVNTFGNLYGVEEVVLTVEGEPYSSGHMSFEEGEAMPVSYDMVTEGQE